MAVYSSAMAIAGRSLRPARPSSRGSIARVVGWRAMCPPERSLSYWLQPVGSKGRGGAGLAVAASTQAGSRAAFSNTGSWVSIAAPGENVFGSLSTSSSTALYPRATVPGLSGLHGFASGTSFAAPQVAAAAALVWGAKPSLTARQVAQILKDTASGHGVWTSDLGFGVIDVAAAVARATQLR